MRSMAALTTTLDTRHSHQIANTSSYSKLELQEYSIKNKAEQEAAQGGGK